MSSHERYTHGQHESVLRTYAWRTVDNSAQYLVPYLEAGAHVLDIGSGPGNLTLDIGRRVAPGAVIGIDASAEVVAAANALAADNALGSVSFQVGNAYSLDFPDDSFDLVHAHQVLQHVADPIAVLREMRRVVKPGGIVAARDVDYGGTIWAPASPGLTKWADVYAAVHRSNGGEPWAGRELKRWAQAAGFTEIASSASIWCFASDAERDWWGQAWAERALKSDFAPQAIETGVATAADLQQISQAWRQWAEAEDGWFAMPHGEIVARK